MIKYLSVFFLVGFSLVQSISMGQSEIEISLYESEVPNSIHSDANEKKTFNEAGQLIALSKVHKPRLFVYRSEKPNGSSVILCPGGGYQNLNIANVRFIAERLNRMGITAFILTYRLPADGLMRDKSIGSLQDVQQAFRVVRRAAEKWGLDQNKVGLWGSSAGGHLAAMAATHFNKAYETNKDITGLRPDFLILAWPVISFREAHVHKGSRRNLLGDSPNEEQLTDFSPDENITAHTPPTFLVHAGDDPAVPVSNSILFYQALKKNEIPAELHIYEQGGHGFGVAPDVENSWMSQLELWFVKRGII